MSVLIIFLIGLLECQSLVEDGARIDRIGDYFSFTEGATPDPKGNVYFTDQPNNRIYKWSAADGQITLVTEDSGRANGLFISNDGLLISCSDLDNQLWSIDVETGRRNVLITDFEGNLLNGPNDVVQTASGGIYFTDPLYPRDYWTRDPETQQPCEGVYYLPPDRDALIVRVISDLVKPNGIVQTPDQLYMYIADIGDDKTYRYEVQPDGSLTNRKLFANMGSDGMTIDELGNIYLVGDGVTIFNPNGEQIEWIPIDATWTANICFGGEDMRTLFITASEYVYTVRMKVRGVRWG